MSDRSARTMCAGLGALLLAFGGCDSRADPRVVRLLGAPAVDAVKTAPRIRSFRMIEDGTVREGPLLSHAQASDLRGIILDGGTYQWDLVKGCVFHPDVKFCFQDEHGDSLLIATLCFTCCEWRFDSSGGQAVEDFDPARLRLERLVMELFPDHPVSPR